MTRDTLVALFLSFLVHGGLAASGYFYKKPTDVAVAAEEIPTIEVLTPPPPEPEEPEEILENVSDEPADISELAPPMQNDVPSAVIDSPFVQKLQAPPPPGLNRPTGAITIPTGPPRTSVSSGLKNIFNLADLDEKPVATFRSNPIYPFDLRRSGMKGEVVVEFIVDTNGNVRDAFAVSSSNSGFEDAAIQAVLKWKFKPGKKGGLPQNTRVRQPLSFSLDAK